MTPKKLFVAINYSKIQVMYSGGGYENEKIFATSNFQTLPKEYEDDNGNKIILLGDDFTDWEKYSLNNQTDFILYHNSSSENVKKIIYNLQDNVIQIIGGSHKTEQPHDKVFQFLMSENRNFNIIIDELFPSVIITNQDGSQSPLYKEATSEAYRQLYKSVTLAYIKEKSGSEISKEMEVVNIQLIKVGKYFNSSSEIQIPKQASVHEIYQFLQTNSFKIEEKLFA